MRGQCGVDSGLSDFTQSVTARIDILDSRPGSSLYTADCANDTLIEYVLSTGCTSYIIKHMEIDNEQFEPRKAAALAVIYEDNHLIVVIKPPNIPSQADESGDLDMLTKVKQYIKTVANKPGAVYCGLVHRLDRVTGGVMVFARTTKAAARLSEQLQNGGFEKKYLAVVSGEPKLREGKLVDYLLKNEKRNVVEVVPSATTGAKRAELEYKILAAAAGKGTLVEIKLITGRSHQARVQMSNLGHPLFGDAKYSKGFGCGHNLALWAHSLTFTHPTTKQQMKFVVNPPAKTPWTSFPIQWSKNLGEKTETGGGTT